MLLLWHRLSGLIYFSPRILTKRTVHFSVTHVAMTLFGAPDPAVISLVISTACTILPRLIHELEVCRRLYTCVFSLQLLLNITKTSFFQCPKARTSLAALVKRLSHEFIVVRDMICCLFALLLDSLATHPYRLRCSSDANYLTTYFSYNIVTSAAIESCEAGTIVRLVLSGWNVHLQHSVVQRIAHRLSAIRHHCRQGSLWYAMNGHLSVCRRFRSLGEEGTHFHDLSNILFVLNWPLKWLLG